MDTELHQQNDNRLRRPQQVDQSLHSGSRGTEQSQRLQRNRRPGNIWSSGGFFLLAAIVVILVLAWLVPGDKLLLVVLAAGFLLSLVFISSLFNQGDLSEENFVQLFQYSVQNMWGRLLDLVITGRRNQSRRRARRNLRRRRP